MEVPDLTVVIPCYNESASIREIVHRVIDAPYAGKEIIVVDDMSTDGTRTFCTRI